MNPNMTNNSMIQSEIDIPPNDASYPISAQNSQIKTLKY